MDRRKFVIGVGSLAAGGAAAMRTGAFTAAEVSGRQIGVAVTDDSSSLVALSAGTTTNDYVYEEGGELVIDFNEGGAGVNPNSTYQLGDVPDDLDSETALDGTEPLENGDISSTYAFSINNQSDTAQDIEVEVEMEDAPDNMSLYFIAKNTGAVGGPADNEEALVAGAATPNNNWNEVLSFTDETSGSLGTGGQILVSLLIERGQKANTDDGTWSGTMSISAGENDDILNGTEVNDGP